MLKFDFFFFLAFTVQFLVVVPSTPTYEEGITIAVIPITIAMLFLAAFWTRKENIYGTAFTVVSTYAALVHNNIVNFLYRPRWSDHPCTILVTFASP